MLQKHNPPPGSHIPPDTLAQAAAYDYEEYEKQKNAVSGSQGGGYRTAAKQQFAV